MLATLSLLSAIASPLPPAPEPHQVTAAVADLYAADKVQLDGLTIPFRLMSPAKVEEGKRYPVVLFLHGAGERGDDNTTQLKYLPEWMASDDRRESMPCFLIAPQCPTDHKWSDDAWGDVASSPLSAEPTGPMRGAIEALCRVVAEHPVDLDRIYLTGLSMGGYGTFDLATRHADWFAAAAPICGGGDETQADRLAGLPLSIWHGDRDDAVPVARSRAMVSALWDLDESPIYRELPGMGHNAWDVAYRPGGCLEWLFEQRRDPARRLDAAARLMAESLEPRERVAFLGDSITQAGNNPGGYVDRLRAAIKEVHTGAVVIPAGISGHKVPDLLAREERDVRAKGATIVFTYIGINDVWHSQSGRGTPLEEYTAGLETLTSTFEEELGAVNIVATPTLIGERPEGDNDLDGMLAGHVAAARAAGQVEGRTPCDLHAAFRDHDRIFNAAGEARGCLTTDGVHLNQAGNILVATEAAIAIRRAALARASEGR
ncbi:GDSL-type esterase/lipase family protein [bacterium]|nr:GDSL-type esterase/lipase family protein [bacterium]